jgi:hypothetical protein
VYIRTLPVLEQEVATGSIAFVATSIQFGLVYTTPIRLLDPKGHPRTRPAKTVHNP